MGSPEPEPQTLAAGELVWARTKGRQHWWPARLRDAAGSASKDAPVSCFGADDDQECRATRLRRFADPAADKMARASTARGFLNALEASHAAAVALLCTGLTCACACASPAAPAPAPAAAAEDDVVVGGVANLSPSEFLASLRRAALDAPAVGLVDRARLKSWTRALAQGWGPAGAGHYPRRSVEELVDKIDLDDLNEPAEEEGADAADEDWDTALEKQLKTPAQGKRRGRPRRGAASLTPRKEAASPKEEDTDAGENGDHKDESGGGGGTGTELSTGRKRKKSKYLSPPYTNLVGYALEDKVEKSADLPKESVPSASKEEEKASRDNVDAREVLELVRSFGEDVFFNESQFPKAAERFLGLFRSKNFAGVDAAAAALVSDSGAAVKLGKSVLERSRKKDEVGVAGSSSKRKKKVEKTSPTATLDFPAENAVAEASVDVAGLVIDSSAALEKGKGVMKRGRKKKDQDGSDASSIKRKRVEKTSPKATPQLAVENVSADGTGGLVPHSCATVEQVKGVTKRGRKKKDQDGSGAPPIKRKRMKKTSPTAILDSGLVITPAIPIRQLMRAEDLISQVGGGAVQGVVTDLALRSGLLPKDGDISQSADGNTNIANVEVSTVQGVVADVAVGSGLLPKHGGISQPADGSTNTSNVEVSTVQGVVADVAVRTGLLPKDGGISQQADGNANIANVEVSTVQGVVADEAGLFPKHGDISQLADANTKNANLEVRAVQESYASLEAMVPEMYKKVDGITTGTNVTATVHGFKAEGQNGERTSQEKTAGKAVATISTNGTYSDAPAKRRNKKAANPAPQYFANPAPQHFANPAEIMLEFRDGVILPSKEELLSEFSKFGILIESLSDILEDIRGARVVFGKSAEADAVYARRETPMFGQFGRPYATLKVLSYLPPFTPSIPAPLPALKPPLGVADMKKNVENMMSALAGKKAAATSSSAGANPVPPDYLLGEMQRLLSRLHNVQPGPSGSARAPQ